MKTFFLSIIIFGLSILLFGPALLEIDKKLDKILFEISAMNTRMDSLEFFNLPVRKNGKGF